MATGIASSVGLEEQERVRGGVVDVVRIRASERLKDMIYKG